MNEAHDGRPERPGQPERTGHPRDAIDAAAIAAVDVAVIRALDRSANAPLAEDFARRVAADATAEAQARRDARRAARATWIGLATLALLVVLAAPALAPTATAVFAPLARTLGPTMLSPTAGLLLVSGVVLWALGYAFHSAERM